MQAAARSTPADASTWTRWPGVLACAALHAGVDAACGLLLWRGVHSGVVAGSAAWAAFVTYSLLAFATQPVIGAAADRVRAGWTAVGIGLALVGLALALPANVPGFAVALVLAGLGNATFHIGGGRIALLAQPGRATWPGVFVAPGAAGLALGISAGRAGADPHGPQLWALGALTLLVAAASFHLGRGWLARRRPARATPPLMVLTGPTSLVLLLLVVVVRAAVGMSLVLPWRTEPGMLAALTTGVVAGKAGGGWLADRFGWRLVGCGSLLASLPLLLASPTSATAGIAAFTLFNMTMPVTVAAAARLLPGDEGLAFGLTCLALYVGSIPAFLGWGALAPLALVAAVLLAAGGLWWAIGALPVRPTSKPTIRHPVRSQT